MQEPKKYVVDTVTLTDKELLARMQEAAAKMGKTPKRSPGLSYTLYSRYSGKRGPDNGSSDTMRVYDDYG